MIFTPDTLVGVRQFLYGDRFDAYVDSSNQVPDRDTLGRFRNPLIRNGLQEKLFAQVVAALMERVLILKKGTIVDSTILSAPSSTKNKEKKRDPDAHQVKKWIVRIFIERK